jgi:UDP-N-acetylglucosamine--N-acetylmuramyl-(pentapeptide) pyrophosphoryl-undecaprenol N-acetylglucosamine transferase
LSIVLTGGGSGGHITPLLPLARALKRQAPECRLVYVGLKGDKIDTFTTEFQIFDEAYAITSGKFRRYYGESVIKQLLDIKTVLLNVRDLGRVWKGYFQAKKILRKESPRLVFSKGGFVAVPVGLAARKFKLPIITHDSDAVPGLANRIVGRWASVHATGMPAEYYNYPKGTIAYVGIPMDEKIKSVTAADQKDFKAELGIPAGRQVLFVSGGGLGSQTVNEMVIKGSSELVKQNVYILHITGLQHEANVRKKYKELLGEDINKVQVLGFTNEFYKYAAAADVVISRAGATTLAELALQRKAVVLIPAPFLTAGQQLKNAKSLSDEEAVEIVDDKAAPEELLKTVEALLKDKSKREKLAKNLAKTAHPNAAAELAEIILKTAGERDAR